MATQEFAELCVLLVNDFYGPVAAKLMEILLQAENLSSKELARRSKLPHTTVLRSLVSLVQNRYVQYWTKPKSMKHTTYSANPSQIYSLVWSGQFLEVVLEENPDLGDEAAAVLKTLVTHGHMRKSNIIKHHCSLKDAQEVIVELARRNILTEVHQYDFWLHSDLMNHLMAEQHRLIGADARTLALSEVNKKLQVASMASAELNRLKELHAKQQSSLSAELDAVYAVNYSQFLIYMRRRELVALAARLVGSVSAKVYEQLLMASERNIRGLHEKRIAGPDTTVSSASLSEALKDTDLASAFVNEGFVEEGGLMKRPVVKEDPDAPASDIKRAKLNSGRPVPILHTEKISPHDLSHVELVSKHLLLLENSSVAFVIRVGDADGGHWFVPYDKAVEDLRRVTFDDVVVNSFGGESARIIRMVRETGMVDEKTLSQSTLLQQNAIRLHVSNFLSLGFLDLQEIPKGNDRVPGRSFFLWFHRAQWAHKRMTLQLYQLFAESYKTIANLRKEHATLLGKLDRLDVRDQQEEFLTNAEKDELRRVNEAQLKIYADNCMYDRFIRIFRDY